MELQKALGTILVLFLKFSLRAASEHRFHIINPKQDPKNSAFSNNHKSKNYPSKLRPGRHSHLTNAIKSFAGHFLFSLDYESWPVLYKGGQKQMANLLWYEEGLYVDLPFGYIDNMTEFYDHSGVISYVQKVRFPPRLYYPVSSDTTAEDGSQFGQSVLSQVNDQMLEAESAISYSGSSLRGKLTRKRPSDVSQSWEEEKPSLSRGPILTLF